MTHTPAVRPTAVMWFFVYCGVLCAIYVAVVAAGAHFITLAPANPDERFATLLTGWAFAGVGALCLAASAAPFFLPQRPWVWVYDLVIICLGMTSACFLPASIPLLIFWMKPDVKAHFGRLD